MLIVSTAGADTRAPERLVVAHSANHTPFSFLNAEGEPDGVIVDLWRLFAEKNGIDVEFKLVDWHQSLELVREGEADLHGGLTESEKRRTFLDFADEILRIRTLLFVPIESEKSDLADFADEPVGVIQSTFDQDFIETHFPQVKLVTFSDSQFMVDAAVRGDVHAFVSDYPTGFYRLLLVDSLDQFRSATSLYTESIRPAVSTDAGPLLDFINAGLKRLTREEKQRILDRWLVPPPPRPDWVLPALIGGLIVIVVILAVSHYWTLRRLVRNRTLELNQKIDELAQAKTRADHLVRTDALTGVGSRRAFYEKATEEIERTTRYHRPLCLVLFDLDEFKQTNDQYGHLAGDSVIKAFVAVIRLHLRDTDFLGRVGGDEFAALLPETSQQEAEAMVRRMLDKLRSRRFEFEGQRISISFSAGVAEYEARQSIDDWIQSADRHLYRGKSGGRGRVVGQMTDPLAH